MGEITGSFVDSPENLVAKDNAVSAPPEGKVKTDVTDIFADGEYKGTPVFDVSTDEFYNNMKQDRKRLRFKTGSVAGNYMRKTKYNLPFYIRNMKDGYLRKIK